MTGVLGDDPLVALSSTQRLKVEPIWVNQIDDIEGPLYSEYIADNPSYTEVLVRAPIEAMLEQVSQNLPNDWRLIVRAGHRPLQVQYKLLEHVKQSYIKENPNATDKQVLDFARTFVSDPAVKLPPHCCGAAVDIDVLDVTTGKLIDFGCPMNTDDEIAFLNTNKINQQQKDNRTMLLAIMTNVGFAPFDSEWWHFSYGDMAWANYYKKDGPIYGLVEA